MVINFYCKDWGRVSNNRPLVELFFANVLGVCYLPTHPPSSIVFCFLETWVAVRRKPEEPEAPFARMMFAGWRGIDNVTKILDTHSNAKVGFMHTTSLILRKLCLSPLLFDYSSEIKQRMFVFHFF